MIKSNIKRSSRYLGGTRFFNRREWPYLPRNLLHPVAGRPAAGVRFFCCTPAPPLLLRVIVVVPPMMAAERIRIYEARKTDIFQDNKTSREFLCESTGEEL